MVIEGDCLNIMPTLPDKSVDMILCDLPYGTTACKWDTVIPFEPLWKEYKRLIKDNGAIVLMASQPFTSALTMSNVKMFRYALIWDKVNRYTGTLLANKQPMKRHEDVLIFYKSQPTFNKQYRDGEPYFRARQVSKGVGQYAQNDLIRIPTINNGQHNPCSIIEIKGDNKLDNNKHPTQKPVALFEYLIRTYTNEGDTVLDNCAGSGTTGVACINTNRKYILIEKDPAYCEIIRRRIAGVNPLFAGIA
jgi:site-specific DNA-methyltransferase (adenine-specific)